MFRLHTSNDAAELAKGLGERLTGARGNPLTPARVLVPQAGLRRWLQVFLAERLGVLANVEFTPPAQFAWELLRAAQPDLPRQSPFDVEVLRWHIHALLGERLDGPALAPLRDYLVAGGDPLRRYSLSLELARAYERMQGYRRGRLLGWEQGKDRDEWQAELWRRLLPRIGGVSRAARVDDWLRRFDPEYPPGGYVARPAPPGLPAQFACFACANVSPDVLRMLAVAGHNVDVDFFLPLPSREYLGDLPRTRAEVRERLDDPDGENPLALSLGGAASGFIRLLYGYEHVRPDAEVERFASGIERASLLGRVRDDILNDAAPREDDRAALPDASLQFHACHTPLREVQTLHDALLAMLQGNPQLQPRDIAVMLPDVATYVPAIEAVFGGIERNDPRWLPFNLGDTGAAALHPVAQLFLDLLDAPTSRWEVDAITDVLTVPGVMRRFDLDADAVERLSRRLREAGVRWGEDQHTRADSGGYREFSWAFGIDRLVAGFACGDVEGSLVGDTAPLAGVEGAAFAHLDAALAVTATWRRLREASRRVRSAAQWQAFLNEILDGVYQPDPRDAAECRSLERIRNALAGLARTCDEAGGIELPWADVRAFLRDALADPDPQQFLFTGGITFCGMVPLRVVPFRVICLLGMDEAAFPRRESSGLDPLLRDHRAGKPETGDRDIRADDRLLFLQLLAAARDVFYVSWIGRDAHTNEALPPSVVVSELIDVVRARYLRAPGDKAARDRQEGMLPQVEPLHAFDARLFGAEREAPRSFQAAWLPAARARHGGTRDLPPFAAGALPVRGDAPPAIRLDELQRFFDNPARAFLEGALKLRVPRDPGEEADLEPLQPDHPLLRYDLATAILEHDHADGAAYAGLLRAQGRLPPGEFAGAALAIAGERAALLDEAIASFTRGGPRVGDVSGTVPLDGTICVAGAVKDVYPAGLVRWSPGGFSGKRVLRAWLDTLFVALVRDALTTCRFLWIDQDTVQRRDIVVAGADAARARFLGFIVAYRDGLRQPLPLFPDASAKAFKLERQSGPRERAEDRADFVDVLANIAARADEDGEFANASDFEKPEVRLAWRGVTITHDEDALAARLHDAARTLFPRLQPVPKGQS